MKAEVRSLMQKGRASLEAARVLARERYWDFAASRAYYAMFYTAEALLLNKGLSFSSHSAVIAAYGKEFALTKVLASKFHRYLIDGQDLRNAGDYDVGSLVTETKAKDILAWAGEFIAAAETHLGS